ncbi:MAG: hypothetical protein CM1200mP39_23140 [Dehalococcoidia bacterium]|nr:MAG: hypothetical protein CM1200mP39_23140 [Dehalococcoidia bacterium]
MTKSRIGSGQHKNTKNHTINDKRSERTSLEKPDEPAITRYPVKAEIHAPNKAAYQFTGAAAFTELAASNKPAPAMAGVATAWKI